jgi:hypothetical protein
VCGWVKLTKISHTNNTGGIHERHICFAARSVDLDGWMQLYESGAKREEGKDQY